MKKNHFDVLYKIAVDKDEAGIQKLQKSGINIDNLDFKFKDKLQIKVYPFNGISPAGACARDGNIESAEWMRNHGASVDYIAQGAAMGGQIQYAETLRTQQGANVDLIAKGAARGGFIEYAETLHTQHGADVVKIAKGAARGGHIECVANLCKLYHVDINLIARCTADNGQLQYAESLCTQYGADLELFAKRVVDSAIIQSRIDLKNKQSIYSFLVEFQTDICRNAIAKFIEDDIENLNFFKYHRQQFINEPIIDVKNILKIATRTVCVKKKYQLDLVTAERLCQNNNFQRYITWFMQVSQSIQVSGNQSLPSEIVFIISRYLVELNAKQTQDLWDRLEVFYFRIKQQAIINALKPFTRWYSLFSVSGDIRSQAKNFINEIQKIEDYQTLINWLVTSLKDLRIVLPTVTKNSTNTVHLTQQQHPLYPILTPFAGVLQLPLLEMANSYEQRTEEVMTNTKKII